MKTKIIIILGCALLVAVITTLSSCKKANNAAPTCNNTGTSVNLGSTGGGTFYTPIGGGDLGFDNTNLNFSLNMYSWNSSSYFSYGCIMDVGPQSCPDFPYSGKPSALTVAYVEGHGYVGIYANGYILRFIAGAYNNGTVNISYISSSPPTASFSDTIANPGILNVTFKNTSANATSYNWDFGDGDTSTLANPIHAYATYGTYTVTLTAICKAGSGSKSQSITLPNPALFTDTIVTGTLKITFQNISTNATSYNWDFGDGNSSILANPVHTYSTFGKYTVSLTIISSSGSFSSSKSITVPNPIFIGNKGFGGIIVYIDSTGIHGLVAASTDQGVIAWDPNSGTNTSNYNPQITGATGTGIGTGASNTNLIIAKLGNGSNAASVCRNYNGGGFNDWFLPSKDEVEYLIINHIVSQPSYGWWSSSEGTSSGIFGAWFTLGYYHYEWVSVISVRAFRYF